LIHENTGIVIELRALLRDLSRCEVTTAQDRRDTKHALTGAREYRAHDRNSLAESEEGFEKGMQQRLLIL
jgi:hypothetical protein